MDPSQRGALTLVRLIGVLFVVATILALGFYWAECAFAKPPQPVQLGHCLLLLVPAVVGLVILVKAKVLADWLANLLDQ